MYTKPGISLLPTLIVLTILGLVGAGIYYRGSIADKLQGLRDSNKPISESSTVSPPDAKNYIITPTSVPAPTKAPTTSIAELNPNTTVSNLPKSGSESTVLVGMLSVTLVGATYYYLQNRKLRSSARSITIQ